jgi:hypothetical protein
MAQTKARKWDIDLNAITIKEYRGLFVKDQTEEYGDEIVGKTVGLKLEEVQALGFHDHRQLVDQFFKEIKEPLADPNSASGCTSPSSTETPLPSN